MSNPIPVIGSVGEAESAPTPLAAPTTAATAAMTAPAAANAAGTAAVPSARAAAGAVRVPTAPPLVSVPGSPQVVHVNQPPSPRSVGDYEPPAARLPDPPAIPGKWVPEYTKDRKSYVVPGPDGVRKTDTCVRATTLSKALDDTTALTDWKQRAMLLGVMNNPDLLDELSLGGAAHLSELQFTDKRALDGIARRAARCVGADDGNVFGTKLHRYLEAILEGVVTLEQCPVELQPYLVVLFAAMREHKLSFVSQMVERTVFIPATGLVGTLDFMVLDEQGTLMIGDLKTSGSIDFSWIGIAIQLAQYANATMMLSRDGSCWEQMPEVSKVVAKVAAVPKDAPNPFCRIYSVDLGIGAEGVRVATWVRNLRETALRCASHPELRQADDELVAWADGSPVTAYTAGL